MGTLLEALVPSTRATLLVTLLGNPDSEFYLRQLITLAGKGRGSVQRELEHLVAAEIVLRRDDAGRSFYRANPSCPIFAELKAIVDKTGGILALLESALRPLKGVELAFVFGSVARGEERSHSDIDLAVIGDVTFRAVVKAIGQTQLKLGREINPVVFSVAELRQRVVNKDHFVREVLRAEKQFVIGTNHDLEAVAREQVAR